MALCLDLQLIIETLQAHLCLVLEKKEYYVCTERNGIEYM